MVTVHALQLIFQTCKTAKQWYGIVEFNVPLDTL